MIIITQSFIIAPASEVRTVSLLVIGICNRNLKYEDGVFSSGMELVQSYLTRFGITWRWLVSQERVLTSEIQVLSPAITNLAFLHFLQINLAIVKLVIKILYKFMYH